MCMCTHMNMRKHLHVQTHMGKKKGSQPPWALLCLPVTCNGWQTGHTVCMGNIEKSQASLCLEEGTSYRGMGLRSPGFSCSFWASQGRWELTEAPGAAEVGAQGVGGGTGLPEDEVKEEVSRAQPRLARPHCAPATSLAQERHRHRMPDLSSHRAHAAKRGRP